VFSRITRNPRVTISKLICTLPWKDILIGNDTFWLMRNGRQLSGMSQFVECEELT